MNHIHIPLHGTPNFRDLGGYNTRCGRTVKTNKLFRSGTLTYLNENDWQTIASLGINIICDFRREDERLREPTNPPESLNIQQVEMTVNPGNHSEFFKKLLTKNNDTSINLNDFMCKINRDMAIKCSHIFSNFLHQIVKLENDNALLFHCAAGKDRTGFGAALILSCLNVEREIIEQDYLLTRQYFIPDIEISNIVARYNDSDWDQYDPKKFIPVLETKIDYIQSAFQAIDEHWGSIENYIEDELKIGQTELEYLRSTFLN